MKKNSTTRVLMMKLVFIFLVCTTPLLGQAAPIVEMNKAFSSLSSLFPFLVDQDQFAAKENERKILENMTELQAAFNSSKHDPIIKKDLFAPSYALIAQNINETQEAFKKGNKSYAHWRLKGITSLCIDCHTRMPSTHLSSFQNNGFSIDQGKFETPYALGLAQLIVRRYTDAKKSFSLAISEKRLKKDSKDILLPFKQLLLIEIKVLRNPGSMLSFLEQYKKEDQIFTEWIKRLEYWQVNKSMQTPPKTDKEVQQFITKELVPLKQYSLQNGKHDVDFLAGSGLLSHYLFKNPASKMAPEINYWLGWLEKHLQRERFFTSGDLFFKQCIKRYPSHSIAKMCLDEYKDSVEFEFTGSAGTNIPSDIQKEIDDLAKLIQAKPSK